MIEKLGEYSIFGIAQQAYDIVDEGLMCLDDEGNDFVVTHEEIDGLRIKIEMAMSEGAVHSWKCGIPEFVEDRGSWKLIDQMLQHEMRITGMPVNKRIVGYSVIMCKYLKNRRDEYNKLYRS